MLSRSFLFAFLLLLSTAISAQGFQLQYGGTNLQEAVATVSDAQGHSTLVRETFTTGDRVRIRLLRTDLQGQNQQWYDVGITGACFVHAAVPSADGKILLCGSRIAPGRSDQDALIAKISHTGEVLWSWTSDTPDEQEELRDLKQTADGGIIAAGTWRGSADSDVLLLRTDVSGELLWQQHYGTSGEESGNGVAFDGDGYMIAGRIGGFSGDLDAYVVRTDNDGNELWWQSWGGIKKDLLKGIAHSGSVFVMAGYTDSYGPQVGVQHVRSVYMIAMNAAGDTLWTRTIGDIGAASSAEDIQVAGNGDFFLSGQSGNSHLTKCMVMRVSPTGNQLWKRTYDIGNEDLLHRLTLLPDGGFIAAGRTFGPGSMQAVLVRKNASGN
ncbi:MAG: hypothetical protein WBG34_03025 [Flavobacteriales bacterium]